MPAPLQIRNVPDVAIQTLKSRATRAGVSLNAYLLDLIQREVAPTPMEGVLDRVALRTERSPVSALDVVLQGRDGR